MKQIKTIKTETYKSGSWQIDIVEEKTMFHAWLQRGNMGVKQYMFGWHKEQRPNGGGLELWNKEMFLELVQANLPEYKQLYNLEVY